MSVESAAASSRPRAWLVLSLLLALLPLSLAGCGQKGDPLPPLRYIPATTTDLSIHQQGPLLIFGMGYPQSTAAGQALPGLEEVRITRLELPLADPERPPEVDPRLFVQSAEPFLTLTGPELQAAISGNRIETRIPIEEPEDGSTLQVFGVRTVSGTGDVSELSNLVRLVLAPPVAPPTDIRTEAVAEGVRLHWQAPDWEVLGYHVYRRPAEVRAFGEPLARLEADRESWLDTDAEYGQRYIYTLRAIRSLDPLIESAPATETEIDYRDRFAPTPPTGVVALGESNRARLVWEASVSEDTVGYHVYRQDPGAEFRRITEQPVRELELVDEGLSSGLTFRYRVTAVDDVGNEGEPSAIAEAEVE